MDSLSLTSDGPNWSMLPSDLLHMVFECLGFADFQRAKCVCSSWKSVSRQSAPDNQVPWMILFPEKGKDYCLLFNPEEKDKMYRIQDLGIRFANSHCLVICGSWLFMRDSRYNFYIMNPFTRERIDLPSMESLLGMLEIERAMDYIHIDMPLFWIDEKTKDYVVSWLIECRVMAYAKNGNEFWKQTKLPKLYSIVDGVYKDRKLYLYNSYLDVTVLDFSGDIPRLIFETQINYESTDFTLGPQIYPELGDVREFKETHFVVTVTGEFLRVESTVMSDSDVWSFRIYKMDSSQSKWDELTSLEDEAILLDQRTTVLANTIVGIKRNSIYFSGIHNACPFAFHRTWREKDIFNFSLHTHKVERPHPSICSSIQLSDGRWFVPNFKQGND